MNLEFQHTSIDAPMRFDLSELVKHRSFQIEPDLRPAFLAHGPAVENLERLVSGRAHCVTTGQQPGLLTGPLYTVYKAISAVVLARTLERQLGTPVVPLFWVAGDDHDFAEANHLDLLTVANTIERVTLRDRAPTGPLRPMYREPVGNDVTQVLTMVARETPDTEYKQATMDWISRHYDPATDLATAFAGALAELLGPYGLVVFQPTHEAAKRAAAPWLLSALESATALDKSLTDRASQLQQVGRPAPIAVGRGASTVMIESAMERDRIVLEGGEYRSRRSGEPWTMERLRLVAEQEPQRLSANVLLRPVVEAALLPTLAYVAGPGELAYIPQAKPLYEALQVNPQATIPRWSARVVEGRVAKILAKFGVTVEDLAEPEGQLEARLVRDDIPEGAAAAIASIRSVLEQDYEQLAASVGQVDVTLEKPVRASRQNSLRSLADIEKRIISQLKKQNATVVQQLEKARRNLLPLGNPQERVLNVVPFLVRYGEAFLNLAAESCEGWAAPLETQSSDT